jgi:hypothetical protein
MVLWPIDESAASLHDWLKIGGVYLAVERRPLPNFEAVLSPEALWVCGAAGEWVSPLALAPLRCVLLREASSGRGPLRREEAGARSAVDPRPEDLDLVSPELWRPVLPCPLPGWRRGRSCAD